MLRDMIDDLNILPLLWRLMTTKYLSKKKTSYLYQFVDTWRCYCPSARETSALPPLKREAGLEQSRAEAERQSLHILSSVCLSSHLWTDGAENKRLSDLTAVLCRICAIQNHQSFRRNAQWKVSQFILCAARHLQLSHQCARATGNVKHLLPCFDKFRTETTFSPCVWSRRPYACFESCVEYFNVAYPNVSWYHE